MRRAEDEAAQRPLALARRVLAGEERAWVVGGAVRDRELRRLATAEAQGRAGAVGTAAGTAAGSVRPTAGVREPADFDLVVDAAPERVARALAAEASAAVFELSEERGGWRVVARDHSWQIDVEPLRGGSLDADLAQRDFTIDAIAETLDGRHTLDPLGGLEDLAARRLRVAAPDAFANDPLRVLRLVRLAVQLRLEADAETLRLARASAAALTRVSGERIFAELRQIIDGGDPVAGLTLMDSLGATGVVLPEVAALRGVVQSRFHHRDVLGHTLEVLQQTVAMTAARGEAGAEAPITGDACAEEATGLLCEQLADAEEVSRLLREPLADGLTRGGALRWGALLHDAAKPLTRELRRDGSVAFPGHDVRGAELAQGLLGRLRASGRLRTHVAALVRNHLRLGFLVHEPQPLARRTVYAYLRACGDVAPDVTLLSVADRLATRGERAKEAIDAHVELARAMLPEALRWRSEGPPRPLLRGDELTAETGIAGGPRLGELLEALREAQFAGEVRDRADALRHVKALLASDGARA